MVFSNQNSFHTCLKTVFSRVVDNKEVGIIEQGHEFLGATTSLLANIFC